LGDPLPDDIEVLPAPERLHGCAVVEQDTYPSPPVDVVGSFDLGANQCAVCGGGDRPHDRLVPFGTGSDHSWQHRECWNERRRAQRAAGPT
jgi:hypothetical protein